MIHDPLEFICQQVCMHINLAPQGLTIVQLPIAYNFGKYVTTGMCHYTGEIYLVGKKNFGKLHYDLPNLQRFIIAKVLYSIKMIYLLTLYLVN